MIARFLSPFSPKQRYGFLVVLFLAFGLISIHALAYPLNPNRIIETFLFCLIAHRLTPKLLSGLLFVFALILLLYHPTASLYGRPSFGIIASLISTNASEAGEYLKAIPPGVYASSVLLALLAALMARFVRHIPAPRFGWRWLLPMCAVIVVAAAQTARKPYQDGGFALRVMPIEFIADSYLMPKAYFAELDKLQHNLQLPADWQIASTHQSYRNYVLVIGESMRTDYMSLYGFKVANTPFLNRRANVVMENVMAPGPNTPISLLHGLSVSDGQQFQIQNNLITLAQAAGMRTAWLSNQGALGKYDTSVAAIGQKADRVHFLKTTGYNFGAPSYDSELLPLLQDTLKQPLPAGQTRLIVLHLLGSHPDPCDRLQQAPRHYSNNTNINCYIDSIRATDKLLESTENALARAGEPYSLLYFSDHGLAHDQNNGGKNAFSGNQSVLRHNDRYRQNYHIPFVIINSGDQRRWRNPALRSGEHLLNGLSQWLGIHSRNLAHSPDFFAPTPDRKVRVLTMSTQWRPLDQLADDPPPLADIHAIPNDR